MNPRSAIRSAWLAVLAVALPATARQLAAQQPADPRVPARSPFTAVAHFEDPQFAADAQQVLDGVWDLAVAMFGRPRGQVTPMVVHCYREHADYASAAAVLGGPDPRVYPGFADFDTKSAHYFVGAAARDEDGALGVWVRSGITHEAMHLAVRAIRDLPMGFYPRWYVEGIAMWAEKKLVAEPGVDAAAAEADTGAEDDEERRAAAAARKMRALYSFARVAVLHRDGRIPKATELLAGKAGNISQPDEYPVFRMLFEMLMTEHAPAMAAMLPESLALPATPAVPGQLRDLVQRAIGEAAWQTLDARYCSRTAEVATAVPEAAFVPPADQEGTIGDADFHPGSPDVRWAGTLEKDRLQVDATVTLRRAGGDQTDFVFGQHGTSWLRVCFVAGAGVFVMARDQEGETAGGWLVLARSGKVDALAPGVPLKMRIVGVGGEVRVDVAGKKVVVAKTGKRPFRGRWGIGAPKGCRANWRNVKVQQ